MAEGLAVGPPNALPLVTVVLNEVAAAFAVVVACVNPPASGGELAAEFCDGHGFGR